MVAEMLYLTKSLDVTIATIEAVLIMIEFVKYFKFNHRSTTPIELNIKAETLKSISTFTPSKIFSKAH